MGTEPAPYHMHCLDCGKCLILNCKQDHEKCTCRKKRP
jgi:hypothetical protein